MEAARPETRAVGSPAQDVEGTLDLGASPRTSTASHASHVISKISSVGFFRLQGLFKLRVWASRFTALVLGLPKTCPTISPPEPASERHLQQIHCAEESTEPLEPSNPVYMHSRATGDKGRGKEGSLSVSPACDQGFALKAADVSNSQFFGQVRPPWKLQRKRLQNKSAKENAESCSGLVCEVAPKPPQQICQHLMRRTPNENPLGTSNWSSLL